MIITRIAGGLGNQFCQYVAGRLLAHKLNTELKMDLANTRTLHEEPPRFHVHYRLGEFNIQENFATPEEIKRVKENGLIISSSFPDLEAVKGDIYMQGQWPRFEKYFADIIDIVRKEFTLKKPFTAKAEEWKNKILANECSVSMHFRHGDFAYNPNLISNDINLRPWFNILPLDYYYTCVDILKQRYDNLTVFVFSNNMPWVKKNLRLDVPTEFVEGCETDDEEFILMSLCKHNINPSSSFSECASSLNSNPDKKIFGPAASTAEGVAKFLDSLTASKKDYLLDTFTTCIRIPFDYYNQPEITLRPIFSLLLVVNNDAAIISETLDSLLGQDYKYYEVIIIDNASTDGSGKICREAIKDRKNVKFKRMFSKVSNAQAWGTALKISQGYYVSFLKGDDHFVTETLTKLYLLNEYKCVDIIQLFTWLEESENGTITFGDKKYSEQRDNLFQNEKRVLIMSGAGQAVAKLILEQRINRFLGTKIFNREFLSKQGISFDRRLSDADAELFFQIECFFKSKYFMHIANAFYIAPRKQ